MKKLTGVKDRNECTVIFGGGVGEGVALGIKTVKSGRRRFIITIIIIIIINKVFRAHL